MSSVRIQGGEAGGRRLAMPRGIRPTQGLVREAIFNLVGPAVEGAVVLDLFAGSGAFGIEALSRGAASAVLVEREDSIARVARRNLEAVGLGERGRVVRSEVTRWLRGHPDEVAAASLVFLDPPYNDLVLAHALALLDALAAPGATVVAEHAQRQALPQLARLHADRRRRYGDTAVSVLRRA